MTFSLRAVLAARDLDLSLDLADGERVAVLGPNGAGKSTTLSVIAGILRPDVGRAELDGEVLFDLRAGSLGRWVAPHRRGVSLMAQDPLLFPHLTVVENVAFGPRAAGHRHSEALATARGWLERVDASDLAARKPAQLSGGQAQRVAIARALASDPRLLLLDEPMAALDVSAAPMLRRLLREVLADRSAVIITHDLLDALLLAQRVIVLEGGHVVESGPTAEVIRHPRTPFTARIAGLNLVQGVVEGHRVRSANGDLIEGTPRVPLVDQDTAIAVFSPSAVSIFSEPPHGSPRNTVGVTVTEIEPRDDQVRIRAHTPTGQSLMADVTAPVVSELDLYPGAEVYYSVKAAAVTLYPA